MLIKNFIKNITPLFLFMEIPVYVLQVLLNSNKELNKLYDYSFLTSWLGDGLLLSTGKNRQT